MGLGDSLLAVPVYSFLGIAIVFLIVGIAHQLPEMAGSLKYHKGRFTERNKHRLLFVLVCGAFLVFFSFIAFVLITQ